MSFFLPSSGSNSGQTTPSNASPGGRNEALTSGDEDEQQQERYYTDSGAEYEWGGDEDEDKMVFDINVRGSDSSRSKGSSKESRKDKGKHKHIDPRSRGESTVDFAKNAYLSPPLTIANAGLSGNRDLDDAYLFGVDVSRTLTVELVRDELDDLDEVGDDDDELEEDGEGEDVFSSWSDEEEEEQEPERGRRRARDRFVEINYWDDDGVSSVLSSQSGQSLTTTRRATVGDVTRGDITIDASTLGPSPIPVPHPQSPLSPSTGSPSPLPSTQGPSPLSPSSATTPLTEVTSSKTARAKTAQLPTPLSPRVPPFHDISNVPTKPERERPSLKKSHRRSSGIVVRHGRKRRLRLKREEKSQERGLSRDFFLIIALCFGLACAGVIALRPTFMALFGYGTLGGRLVFE